MSPRDFEPAELGEQPEPALNRAIRRANAARAKRGLAPLTPGYLGAFRSKRRALEAAAKNGSVTRSHLP